jgi:uncharacterized protein DUF4280
VPLPLVAGAQTMCSFGMAPSTLVVTPEKAVLVEGRPVANILDTKPFVNILPFGLCTSLANPVTASQTAAALGVLTPGPCTPVTVTPWLPGAPTGLAGPAPAAHQACTCQCAYGGVITVTNPGSTRTIVG